MGEEEGSPFLMKGLGPTHFSIQNADFQAKNIHLRCRFEL